MSKTRANPEYDRGYKLGYADGEADAFTKVASVNIGSARQAVLPKAPTQADKDVHLFLNILTIIMSVPYAIYQAFVLSKLWQWFVLSNFHKAPHLGIVSFMGITMMIALLFASMLIYNTDFSKTKQDINEKINEVGGRLLAWPLLISFALLFGYIYSLFM